MGKTMLEKKGVVFIVLSLPLAPLVIGAWVIFGPILFTKISTIEITNFIFFVFGCIGMTLVVLGVRDSKRAGISWPTIMLSIISLLLNGVVLFFASIALVTGPPEVKGVVQNIGNDFIAIYVDESYRDEYNMDGSQLTSADGLSATPEDLAFLVGTSNRTIFFEQYGKWAWQKKVVNGQSLQEGQHIQIKYNGWRYLSGSIIEAEEIIILNE